MRFGLLLLSTASVSWMSFASLALISYHARTIAGVGFKILHSKPNKILKERPRAIEENVDKNCGKKFQVNYSSSSRHQRRTTRVTNSIPKKDGPVGIGMGVVHQVASTEHKKLNTPHEYTTNTMKRNKELDHRNPRRNQARGGGKWVATSADRFVTSRRGRAMGGRSHDN